MSKLTIEAFESKEIKAKKNLSLIKGGNFIKINGDGRIGYEPIGGRPVTDPDKKY